jgi:8-oxo-dGTP pyrophosphatase MutT (NUDIX family)
VSAPVDLPDWLQELRKAASDVAPGSIATQFIPPTDGSGRPAAVLMLFGDSGSGPSVVLLERASTMRKHAGQVAFPGGTRDAADRDVVATALREASEEVGLDPSSVDIIGELPEMFLFVTGFVVAPVLGYWRQPHPLSALDPAEVADVVIVPVSELADPANRFTVSHPRGLGPGFGVSGLFVWGFTAMLLDVVLRLGGWFRPWDETVVRELPQGAMRTEPPPVPGTFEA